MATVVATAGGNIAISITQYIQQNINVVMNQTITFVRQGVITASNTVSRLAGSGGRGLLLGSSIALSRAGISITDITRRGFNIMYKIVKDIVSHPRGVLIAVIMYRTIDRFVPCNESPYVNTLEEMAKHIEAYSIEPIKIELPKVDFSGIKKSINDSINSLKSKIEEWSMSIEPPELPTLEYTCSAPQPPAWWEVQKWFGYIAEQVGYAICNLRFWLEALLKWIIFSFQSMAYFILKGLAWIGERLLDIVAGLTTFIVDLGEKFINAIITGVELLANGFITVILGLVNTFMTIFVKIPAVIFIRYILIPAIRLIVSIFKWIKDNLKQILCYYLNISPYISSMWGLQAGMSKKGILGGFAGMLGSMLATTVAVHTLVPECSALTTGATPTTKVEDILYVDTTPKVEPKPRTLRFTAYIIVNSSDDYRLIYSRFIRLRGYIISNTQDVGGTLYGIRITSKGSISIVSEEPYMVKEIPSIKAKGTITLVYDEYYSITY